jgi:hypothetical protein
MATLGSVDRRSCSAAKTLGLDTPPIVLALADEVIE